MDEPLPKPVVVGSSLKDLRASPEAVQDHVGYALYVAQRGAKHRDSKTLKGFAAGVRPACLSKEVEDRQEDAAARHRTGQATITRG
jgi:phage-related protein